jgi:hypothetical protein
MHKNTRCPIVTVTEKPDSALFLAVPKDNHLSNCSLRSDWPCTKPEKSQNKVVKVRTMPHFARIDVTTSRVDVWVVRKKRRHRDAGGVRDRTARVAGLYNRDGSTVLAIQT